MNRILALSVVWLVCTVNASAQLTTTKYGLGHPADFDYRKLATLGHDIVTVGDGSAAVDACRTQRPDLAVLDIMMPGLTGLEAVKEMRAHPEMADIPVILLTARAQQSDVQIGFESGADDYITKPFSPKDLASRVEALLSR